MQLKNFIDTKTSKLEEIYACTGNRAYLVGAQNGSFPDLGHHVKGEMGGLWIHPIKIMDGFWLSVEENGEGKWLQGAEEFSTTPTSVIQKYKLASLFLQVTQTSFIPDNQAGAIVSYQLENNMSKDRELKVAFLGRSELLPVWLSDNINIHDASDQGQYNLVGYILAEDSQHPWTVVFGSNLKPESGRVGKDIWGPEKTSGQGISGELNYQVKIAANSSITIDFFIAGSSVSKEKTMATFNLLKEQKDKLIEEKENRYQSLLKDSFITTPDQELNEVYQWVKFNLDMLWREVEEGYRGFGAGLPTYPWWFGTDTVYTILGALPMGYHEQVKQSLITLAELSEKANGNGRIIHESSSNGVVGNKGNIQETPHFVKAVYQTYKWTGDQNFIEKLYPLCKKAIKFLINECDSDGDLLAEGYGIMEIKGFNLELIDTAVYTYEGLKGLKEMALILEDKETADWASSLIIKIKEQIEKSYWNEEDGLYHDMVGTPRELLGRIDDIYWQMEQSPNNEDSIKAYQKLEEEAKDSATPDQDQSWLFKQWVIATPMEAGLTSNKKAEQALQRLETDEYTNQWGFKISGYGRDGGQVMTISTSVMAVAEARYGRMDQALDYIKKMCSTKKYQMPGSISEMSPDYGCCIQAWTAYGFGYPLIVQMAGINPDAGKKQLELNPVFPTDWDEFKLNSLKVGSNKFDYSYNCTAETIIINLTSQEAGWTLDLNLAQDGSVVVNGEDISDLSAIKLKQGKNEIKVISKGDR